MEDSDSVNLGLNPSPQEKNFDNKINLLATIFMITEILQKFPVGLLGDRGNFVYLMVDLLKKLW